MSLTGKTSNETRIPRLERQLKDLKQEADKHEAEIKELKKELNLQIKQTNKLRRGFAEDDSLNFYGWITSIVGEDDLYIDQEDNLQDNEIIMINLPMLDDLDNLNGTEKNNDAFFRGMIICSDENILQISSVETGILYCFNKSEKFILTPKQLFSFKYVAIPCALAIKRNTRSMSMVLLKKYANSKTKICYSSKSVLKLEVKMLKFITAGFCKISHINSTAEFYIQHEHDLLKLLGIIKYLKRYENNFVILEAKTGQICVVLDPTNKKWHRARVISFIEKGIEVKLIDYGNNIVVHQVYSLTDSLMIQKPPIAQKCCLRMSRGLGKFSSMAENNFKSMAYTEGGGFMFFKMLKLGSFNLVELLRRDRSIADNLISSQIEKDSNVLDPQMTINSYSYRASMDDNELADLKDYNY